MSKQSFDTAIQAAGFNDETTKISKVNLKAVMNEISDGIWGGVTPKRSLVEVYASNVGDDPDDVNNNLQRGSIKLH